MVQIDFWPQMSDFTIIGMCTVSILQCKIAKNLEKCIGHTKDSFLQRESSLLLFNMWNVPIKKKKKSVERCTILKGIIQILALKHLS